MSFHHGESLEKAEKVWRKCRQSRKKLRNLEKVWRKRRKEQPVGSRSWRPLG